MILVSSSSSSSRVRVVLVLSTSLISDDDDDDEDDEDDEEEEDGFATTFPSLSSSLSIEMLLSVSRNILSTDINTTAMRNKITYLTNRFELILCAKPRPVVFLD